MNDLDQQYHGEFRYVNLGPSKIRAKLASEQDPAERTALQTALNFWKQKQPSGAGAGQPFRGDKREAVHAESMLALGKAVKPDTHVFVRGEMNATDAPMGEGGVIDFDLLSDE